MNLIPSHLFVALAALMGSSACATPTDRSGPPLVETAVPAGGKLPAGWKAGPEPCAVWIVMKHQVDLAALGRDLSSKRPNKSQRRSAVRSALEALAKRRQNGLDRVLERREGVRRLEGLTVMNGLILWATREVVAEIAEREDVAYVVEERKSERGVWGIPDCPARDVEEPWWLEAIGAPGAWEKGLDGEGVVIGFIDSGAGANHEQTRGGYRGGPDSWYDPRGEAEAPLETHPTAHGTSLISLAVGRGEGSPMRGVAPGARWVAALGFADGKFNNLELVLCADWMFLRGSPDVLVSAWEIPGSTCDPSLDGILSAFKAAEVFVLFAAGNHGPGPGTNHSPANSVGIYPGDGVAFSVGGTGKGGKRLEETSMGPNACDPGEIFPRVCAPGDDLLGAHAWAPDMYVKQRGTSFSVALGAGAAAILLQSDPELGVAEIEECLMATARDLGEEGPDNVFGHGLIRIDDALRWLEERRE